MAVTVDVANTGATSTGGTSLTWTHTTGSVTTPNIGVSLGNAASVAKAATAVTYNTVALTSLGSKPTGDNTTTAEIWGLINCATGGHTVAVTFSPSANFGIDGNSLTVVGADQTNFLRAAAVTASANSSAAVSQAVASAAGDLVIDSVADNVGSTLPTKGASQTLIGRASPAGNFDHGSSYEAAAGASVTMTWTVASGDWAGVFGSVKAAAGGGGFTPIQRRTGAGIGTRVGSRRAA